MVDEAWAKGASVMSASATATFLFCDLVGSTALLTRIGDDAADDVRRQCFGTFREAIAEYRGSEVKTLGDGMLVLFQRSVGDAIGCGIAMQRGIASLGRESPLLGLGLRVGVSIGEASSEEGDWFGTPVVEAARLCAAARSGQILVADLVRQLVRSRGGHRFTSLGVMELKGLDPVLVSEAAWEPELGRSVVPLPTALEFRGGLPFVGRQGERAILDSAWRRVEAGRLGVVLMVGEQGVGKTRLVGEWGRGVHAAGGTVLYGRCRDTLEPYEAVAEALAWYVATAPAAELRTQLGPLGGELVRIVPSLLNRFADLPPPGPDVSGSRRRLFDAVEGLLTAAAAASPILLILDDLHLAQPPTLALLSELVEASTARRVLVVAVVAEVPGQPLPLSEIRSHARVQVVPVAGLTDDDVHLLLATATGRAPSDIADQAAALCAETEGNPTLIGQLLAALDESGATVISLPCPYKGLAAFRPEDHELFFGREEVVAGLLARLANGPLVAVGGASGSGKSSVVRAGLLPGVWRGALPGSSAWRTVVMVPGPHPLAELAAQVAPLLRQSPAAVLLRELETDRRTLDLAARQLLIGASPAARLLLVIDQFEELFTICEDGEERERFLDALFYAVGTPGARTSAVVVLRADFYGDAAGVPALAITLETNHVLLGPMREDELRAAIERPAHHVGLRLEPGLTDALVADVIDQPAGLPLLSHALQETWKGRTGRTLTLAAYRSVGGVQGALARSADTVLAALDPERQVIAQHIFLRLVEVGEGTQDTSRRAQLNELNPDDDPAVADVLEQLIDTQLLTAGESTVEIAHEALIRAWPQLRDWLDEDRDGLRLFSHLRTSAHEWNRLGRDPGELQRGARLAATLEWVDATHPPLDDIEREYLDAGRSAEEAELRDARARERRDAVSKRRLRALLAVAAVLLVAVVVAGLLVARQRDRAQAAHTSAELQRLASQSISLRSTQRDLAALLAVEAYHRTPSAESRSALYATFTGAPDFLGYTKVPGSRYPINGVALPDGNRAVVAVHGKELHLLDLDTGVMGAPWPTLPNNPAFSLLKASRDGNLVVDLADLGAKHVQLAVYDTRSGKLLMGPIEPPFLAGDAAISPDGRRVAAAGGQNGDVIVYSVPDGHEVGRVSGLPRPPDVQLFRNTAAVAFSSSGSLLVGSLAGPVRELDPTTLAVRRTLDLGGGFSNGNLALTDEASTLLASGSDGLGGAGVTRVDLTTGKVAWSLTKGQLAEGSCFGLALAERIGRFYCGGLAGRLEERDLASGAPTDGPFDFQQGEVGSLNVVGGEVPTLVAFSGSTLPVVARWRLDGSGPIDHLVARGHAPDGFCPVVRRILVDEPTETYVWDPCTDTAVGPAVDGFASSMWLTDQSLVGLDPQTYAAIIDYDLGRAGLVAGKTILLHKDPGNVAIPTDGSRFFIQQDDEIWTVDATTFTRTEPTIHFDLPGSIIQSMSASPDGSLVAVAGVAGGANASNEQAMTILYDGKTGRELGRTPDPTFTAVIPGGRLVAATNDGKTTLFDLKNLKPITTLAGSRGALQQLQPSADGHLLLATSQDHTVSLYDLASGQRLGDPLEVPPQDGDKAFLRPDGLTMAVGGDEQGIAIWDLDPSHWTTAACQLAGRNLTPDEWKTYLGDLGSYRATCPRYEKGA